MYNSQNENEIWNSNSNVSIRQQLQFVKMSLEEQDKSLIQFY